MKKFTKMMVGAAMLFGCVAMPLTGCSTMFGEDGFVITDMTWVTDKENNVLITFKTTDDENPEVKVTIPHGLSGKEGVGIKSITSTDKLDDKGNTIVTLVVKYTDNTLPDTILSIPLKNGKDGKGIKNSIIDFDQDKNILLTFEYTDGTKSEPILIPKGLDGKDGNGIKNITFDDTTDEDNFILNIEFTSSDKKPMEIKVPKTKDGIGIGAVIYNEEASDANNYALTIKYTNESEQIILLPKLKTTVWHSGTGIPATELGNSGDFYLDTSSGFVYKKGGNEWFFLFSMKGTSSPITFQVTFHPGVGTEWANPQLIPSANYSLPVNFGEYVELNRFPTIKKTGYDFIGWYTSEEYNPNSGHFTDLTPVNKDMNLYPRFVTK